MFFANDVNITCKLLIIHSDVVILKSLKAVMKLYRSIQTVSRMLVLHACRPMIEKNKHITSVLCATNVCG